MADAPSTVRTRMWHDADADADIAVSAYPYANGEFGIVLTVYDVPCDRGKTWISGGPLHGEEEVTVGDHLAPHIKWLWRVTHCEQTHPEYFRTTKGGRRAGRA